MLSYFKNVLYFKNKLILCKKLNNRMIQSLFITQVIINVVLNLSQY